MLSTVSALTAEPDRHAYFPYIDGLRAIAVISVVLYHLNSRWLPGGFAGVDIFFVISGFVVSASVGNHRRTSLIGFELYFLSRRLQRIAPALIVCLLATALVSAWIIPNAWLSASNQSTGRNAFFGFSNLILARKANAYFSPISEFNPYTHTWSLGVEEQFYLLFPLLFWAWLVGKSWRPLVVGLFTVLGAVSLGYAWIEQSVDPLRAFYLLPSRFWELAVGAVLYQGLVLAGRRFDAGLSLPPSGWKSTAAAAALGAMVFGLVTGAPELYPAPGALVPVAATAFALGLMHGMPASSPCVRLLTLAPAQVIGRMSYSLYLWHWPVFVVFRWTYGLEGVVHQALACSIALILAVLSWRYVENPVRRAGWIRTAPRWAVALGGVVILYAGYASARYVDRHQPVWSISKVSQQSNDWYPDREQKLVSPDGCHAGVASVVPVGQGVLASYQRTGCNKPVTGPAVYVIGDSHAMAFGSMFAGYTMDTGAPVLLYNNGGCPFLSLQPARESDAHCKASTQAAMDDMLKRIKPGDVVFLPSLRMPRVVDQYIRFPDASVRERIFGAAAVEARAAAVQSGIQVLQAMHARGASILVEAPNVVLHAPAFRCADAWTRTNPICAGGSTVDRAEFLRMREPALEGVKLLAAGVPTGSVFDPVPVLCPPGPLCDTYRNGRPLFFDGDHVSPYGNSLLLPSFIAAVQAASMPKAATAPHAH